MQLAIEILIISPNPMESKIQVFFANIIDIRILEFTFTTPAMQQHTLYNKISTVTMLFYFCKVCFYILKNFLTCCFILFLCKIIDQINTELRKIVHEV